MSELIKEFEGVKYQAYKCPAGIWTIGYGSTSYPDGTQVRENDTIKEDYAEIMLNDYLIKYVDPLIAKIPYRLTVHQKEALESLIYNVGPNAFLRSKLYKAIMEKDWPTVFKEWDFGYKQAKGLVKRRAKELYYFISGI